MNDRLDLLDIREMLMSYIYKEHDRKKLKELQKISVKNEILIKGGYTFIYEGVRYNFSSRKNLPADANRELHPSLIEYVDEILHPKDANFFEERLNIFNYITATLQFARITDDLLELYPEPLHNYIISNIYLEAINDKPIFSRTDKEIAIFKENNQSNLNTLNNLLVVRMLFTNI